MQEIKFKQNIPKQEIEWLEEEGREKVWDKQKELNSELLEEKDTSFSFYITSNSTKGELKKDTSLVSNLQELDDNEVFIRIEFGEDLDVDQFVEDLIEVIPQEFELKNNILKELKGQNIDTSEKNSDNEEIECLSCGKALEDDEDWFFLQLFQPGNTREVEIGSVCPDCGDKKISMDLEGLDEVIEELNLSDMEEVECLYCDDVKNIEEASDWWLFQILKYGEDNIKIGNLFLVCNNCCSKLEINNFDDFSGIVEGIKKGN